MLAPIIAGLAIGGFLLYTLRGGAVKWESKEVGPGIYNLTAQVGPSDTAEHLTVEQFRHWMSQDPKAQLLMVHYTTGVVRPWPESDSKTAMPLGILHLMMHYTEKQTLQRVLAGKVPGTQLPLRITITDIEKVEDDNRQVPDMPIELAEGAEPYLPPVRAPDNLRNYFANALASGNRELMIQSADTLETLGWPELAAPLYDRAERSRS